MNQRAACDGAGKADREVWRSSANLVWLVPLLATLTFAGQPDGTSLEWSKIQQASNHAWELEGQGKSSQALPLAEQALAGTQQLFGLRDARTADAFILVGRLQHNLGQFARAESALKQAVDIHRAVLGQNRLELAQSLNELAALYLVQANYASAETLLRETAEIVGRTGGQDHPGYSAALSNLAYSCKAQGNYARAEPLYRQVIEIHRRIRGENHPVYAGSLNNLANLYTAWGKPDQAEPLFQRAIVIYQHQTGKSGLELAGSLNDLGTLYGSQADYVRAEPLLREALAIRKKALGQQHPDYLSTLNNLAELEMLRGEYARALPKLIAAREGTGQAFGHLHPRYARSLVNLAGLYQAQGDHPRAVPLLGEAIEILRQRLGENHPELAAALNNLADSYQAQGAYERAEPLLRQALEIKRRQLGVDHPGYARGLNNLAALYYHRGNYDQAEPLYREALETFRRALGQMHPEYAQCLNNLAALDVARTRYADAESRYQQSLEIRRKVWGESHPACAAVLNNLGALYLAEKQAGRAEPVLRQSLVIIRRQLDASAPGQSQRQQLAMLEDVRFYLDSYVAIAANDTRLAAEAYRHVLAWKGMVLRRQRLVRAGAENDASREAFRRLQATAAELAHHAWSQPDRTQDSAWRAKLAELSSRKELLEAELAACSRGSKPAPHTATLEQLQAALGSDVDLVDFLEYDHRLPLGPANQGPAGQTRLAAFILSSDRVELISLAASAPVHEAIETWRRTWGASRDAVAAGRLLRRLVWEPLARKLPPGRTLLVSPDGPLCRLPLAALPGEKPETYLLEERAIGLVPVPQQIPEIAARPSRPALAQRLLLLGNVNYDPAPAESKTSTSAQSREVARTAAEDLEHFDPLAGTQAEIDAIGQLYRRHFGAQGMTILERDRAGKRAVLREARRHQWLHLATHGFFLEEPPAAAATFTRRPSTRFGEMLLRRGLPRLHPGLRAGLALSGANRLETGASFDPGETASNDGLLTAEEIGVQDLDGVQLAVLSACETGLGHPSGGEGLLSLQREFQSAGVRAVIASLWSVPDEETRRLMGAFYENHWQRGLGVLAALREAQLSLLRGPPPRERLSDEPGSNPSSRLSPFYWAAFVISGDWR